MSNTDKACPLTGLTCCGEDCAIWVEGECALALQARKTEEAANDLYRLRRHLEENL